MTTPVIRRATADDIGLVTDILVDAFADDPLINYVLPPGLGGPRLRRRRRRAEIENDYLPRGAEILLDQEERGALIRERPAGPKPPALSAYRYRLDFLRALGWRRGLRMEREWHPIERKHPTWPHVYIGELGVRREHQGQGIGSALLAAGLEPCKTLGVGAYLVTSNPANLPLYRRFGFELVDETRMGRNGPIFRSMWRQPQPSGPDRA